LQFVSDRDRDELCEIKKSSKARQVKFCGEMMENSNGNGVKSAIASEKVLETVEEKKERTKSLIIVYFTLFLQSLGLAIAMTGVWPFLDKVSFN
jgi:hypothetical protein